MLSVYLFCLVLGGGFAVLSAFGDLFDADADVDFDADVDLDLDAGAVSDATDVVEAAGTGAEVSQAAAIFSLRSLLYSLFGFGATGALLTAFGAGPGAPLTLGFSVLAGFLIGGAVGSFLAYLKRSGTRSRSGDRGFVGLEGRVTLPIREGSPGRIVIVRGDREHAVRALPFEGGVGRDPEDWTQVLVLEMRDGVAYVDALRGDGTDLLGPGS